MGLASEASDAATKASGTCFTIATAIPPLPLPISTKESPGRIRSNAPSTKCSDSEWRIDTLGEKSHQGPLNSRVPRMYWSGPLSFVTGSSRERPLCRLDRPRLGSGPLSPRRNATSSRLPGSLHGAEAAPLAHAMTRSSVHFIPLDGAQSRRDGLLQVTTANSPLRRRAGSVGALSDNSGRFMHRARRFDSGRSPFRNQRFPLPARRSQLRHDPGAK